MCGWPSVSAPVLNIDGVRIWIALTPSRGIGVAALNVHVPANAKVSFSEQRIKIESSELPSPLYSQFGAYNKGDYRPIGVLSGPLDERFAIESYEKVRPKEMQVTLPPVVINGRSITPAPVAFTLTQKPGLVGLCQ